MKQHRYRIQIIVNCRYSLPLFSGFSSPTWFFFLFFPIDSLHDNYLSVFFIIFYFELIDGHLLFFKWIIWVTHISLFYVFEVMIDLFLVFLWVWYRSCFFTYPCLPVCQVVRNCSNLNILLMNICEIEGSHTNWCLVCICTNIFYQICFVDL